MKDLEPLYKQVAQALVGLAGEDWTTASVSAPVLGTRCGGMELSCTTLAGEKKWLKPTSHAIAAVDDAFLKIRDALLENAGTRIWSVGFDLQRDGRMSARFGYERPSWYDQSEEPREASSSHPLTTPEQIQEHATEAKNPPGVPAHEVDGLSRLQKEPSPDVASKLDELYEAASSIIFRNAPVGFAEASVAAEIGGESAGGFQLAARDAAGSSLDMDLNVRQLLELQRCFVQVRDHLLRETGSRLWSMQVAVTQDGRFSVTHGYEVPAWYIEEEDPLLAWEETNPRSEQTTIHLREWERQGLSWLQQRTAEDGKSWGLGSESNWDLDLRAGRFSLSFSDGRRLAGQVQVLGTFNKEDGSFLWAWDHPSVPEALRRSAAEMREWGLAHGELDLTQRKVRVDESRLWAWLGFAASKSGADGGYRASSNGTDVYLIYSGMADFG